MSARTRGRSALLVDARWVGQHGIGRFAREIIARLPEARPLPLRGSPTSPYDPLRMSLALSALRPAVFFNPGFNAPLWNAVPTVFTIHDLIHLRVDGEGGRVG